MITNSELLPSKNGVQQTRKKDDRQKIVTKGNNGEKGQTNIQSTNSHPKNFNFGDNLKRVVRYVTIQVPKEPKLKNANLQKVQAVKAVDKKSLDLPLNRMKVRLKPPKTKDSEAIIYSNENDFQEEIEISTVEENPARTANKSSDKHSNVEVKNKKRVMMEQGTQTDLYGWLYKNEKLYSVVIDSNMQCVTNTIPVLKTTWKNLQYFNHNLKRKLPHNLSKINNSGGIVQQKILQATNNAAEEVFISDDSLSDNDDTPDVKTVESKSLASSIKLRKQESVRQYSDLSSEILCPDSIVPRESSMVTEKESFSYSNQFEKPQDSLISLMNEVCYQPLSAVENNQNIFNNDSISTSGSNIDLTPTSHKITNIQSKLLGNFHSKTGNKNANGKHLSAFLSKLYQDLKNCMIEDEFGNIPLHQAVIDDDIKKIKTQCIVLRFMKYNLNHVNSRHETALTVAVKMMLYSDKNPSCKTVEVLLSEGVDQTITDIEGYAPLHYAVKTGCVDLIKLLLRSNQGETVVNKFGNDGLVPVHLAAIENYPEIITQLVNKGCDINAQDRKSGRTPFFFALENRNLEAAKTLIIHNACTSTQNFAGHNPPNMKGIKKLIYLKDNVLKNPSELSKNVKNYVEQVDDQENVLLSSQPATSYSLDIHGKTEQSSHDTAGNYKLTNKIQNKGSTNNLISIPNSDIVVRQNNGKEMFPCGRSNSSTQIDTNLENFSLTDTKKKNSHDFKTTQKLMDKPVEKSNYQNNIRVFLSKKESISKKTFENESPLSHKKGYVKRANCLPDRSKIKVEPAGTEVNGCSVKAASCASFLSDTDYMLETLSDSSKVNNEFATTDDDFSVKTSSYTLPEIDYPNVLETLSNRKINNESSVSIGSRSDQARSCTLFTLDNGYTVGTLSDCKVTYESSVTDCNISVQPTSFTPFVFTDGNISGSPFGCEIDQDCVLIDSNSSDSIIGSYKFRINSPCQELICDVAHDLQLSQTDVHQDSGHKQRNDERAITTSKLEQLNEEGTNKRKAVEILSLSIKKQSKRNE